MIKFQSKAQTLEKLKIKGAIIPKMKIFKVNTFLKNKKIVFNYIHKNFRGKKIVIRSSNRFEDKKKESNAGLFYSATNIDPKKYKVVEREIYNVISSYRKYQHKDNEFFIQEMITDIKMSGVITTCDISSKLPFYTINYSTKNSTDVTSGKKNVHRINIFRENKNFQNKDIKKIINITKKIEKKYKEYYLDIEFILTKKNKFIILQVRPILINNLVLSSKYLKKLYDKLAKKIKKLQVSNPSLIGNTTYFGVMPDWNPAEIIGKKPKPLALSLYKELITDHVWSLQRKDSGFHDVSSSHLLTNFFGTPYVDLRVDFNSWVPKNLDYNTSKKLVNYYLKSFKNNPDFHDKVEFKIIFTCWTFNTKNKLKKLLGKIFIDKEIKKIEKELKKINILAQQNFKNNLLSLENLKKKQKRIDKANMYWADKIYWLVEDCKKYGTYAFSYLARCGFIANDLLNSLSETKVINNQTKINFLQSIQTLSTKMNQDLFKINKKNFLKIYGHLRPNTYEIMSPNYSENYAKYFSKSHLVKKINKKDKIFSKSNIREINKLLKENKIDLTFEGLIKFIKNSIIAREESKFIFSKSVDLIFKYLNNLTKRYQIPRKDLSYININSILMLHDNLTSINVGKFLKNEIKNNKKEFNINKSVMLPDNILNSDNIFYNEEKNIKPNFIGDKNITGKIYFLKNLNKFSIVNKIVCIENADPGYDFIFNYKIKGLVTKYGGVNSHMSIRSFESKIPAVIGVGERIFKDVIDSKSITINCSNKKIDIT